MDYEARDRVEHSGLALYGLDSTPGAVESVYRQCLAWLDRHACPPDKMSTSLDKSDKYLTFARSEKKLRAEGFDEVTSFDVASMAPGARDPGDGVRAEICYHSKDGSPCLVVSIQSAIVPLRSLGFKTIATEAISLTKSAYGIGYGRPFGLWPLLYGMSFPGGFVAYEESLRITGWNGALDNKQYLRGFMRDVYPLNFLTKPHLEVKVHGTPFVDWVGQDTTRGRLSPLTDTVTLWEVEDEHIPAIREVLFDARVIYDYNRDTLGKGPKAPEPAISGEEALRRALDSFGMTAEDVDVFQVEAPGKTRKLSDAEVKKITAKKKRGH